MKNLRWLFLLLMALAGMAQAQTYKGQTLVQPSLIADTATVESGKPFRVGLLLKMAPHWHTYWKYPGDSGLATTIAWTLPPGFTIGELQWPVPKVASEDGGLQVYVYSDEVLLFATVTPPAEVKGEVEIRAKASWLVCEKLCVPGKAELTLKLPAGESEPELFETYSRQVPAITPAALPTWKVEPGAVILQSPKLPVDNGENFFFPNPPDGVLVGHPEVKTLSEVIEVRIPLLEGSAEAKQIPGVLQSGGSAWEVGAVAGDVDPGQTESRLALPGSASPATTTLLPALLFGFLGGLILNLMPCVLPVISLKMFSFVKQAGESRQRVFRLGLAFAGGMFAWFLGLAVVLLIIRSTGTEVVWAQQFQNPRFNIGISVLIFLFALNLFGVYEITLPGAAAARLTGTGDGYAGAFFQGVFATILGTPCTAPYLGTTLAFALTQPPLALLAVFAAIALGMSSPYLLLCANPGWMKFLPKPGLWMVRLKEFMGFLLLATLLWFMWIVGRQLGVGAVIFLGALLVLSALGAWVYGAFLTPVSSRRMKVFGAIYLLLVLGMIGTTLVRFRPGPEVRVEQNFTARLEQALATDRIVFVDFTADWCLSCKVNKRVAIDFPAVQAAFREKNVLFLEADWTNGDPEITKILKQYGRAGVPLYMIHPSNRAAQPLLLPELLTPQIILDALQQASGPQS